MAKAKSKAKPRKRKTSSLVKPMMPRSVEIEKASNGYIIKSWKGDKRKLVIAKTEKEAKRIAGEIL